MRQICLGVLRSVCTMDNSPIQRAGRSPVARDSVSTMTRYAKYRKRRTFQVVLPHLSQVTAKQASTGVACSEKAIAINESVRWKLQCQRRYCQFVHYEAIRRKRAHCLVAVRQLSTLSQKIVGCLRPDEASTLAFILTNCIRIW